MTDQNTPKKTEQAACCGTCDCNGCSCGCAADACDCQATSCDCGCRAPASRS